MDKLQMVDLLGQYTRIKPEIDRAIEEVLTSSAFIQGPQVSLFAQQLASFTGAGHVVPCGNGTDALQIAMMALDLKPGDEVIVPAFTYGAAVEVLALLGIKPVFVDVKLDTFNIDASAVERVLTRQTKAIIPVHLYGQCADMEPILKLADKHGLHVVEDAAQSLGAEYVFSDGRRRQAGTMGIIGITSFFPSKTLGCFGDGGALFTNDPLLAEKVRMICNHGQKVKYKHEIVGVNSRLDTMQAAILSVKLKYIKEYILRRNEAAAVYDRELGALPLAAIPARARYSTHVFHQYTVRTAKRDQLRVFLADKGVPSMIYYPTPLHLQKAYRQDGVAEGAFPVAEELSKSVISIPIHTEMKSSDLNRITTAIKEFDA